MQLATAGIGSSGTSPAGTPPNPAIGGTPTPAVNNTANAVQVQAGTLMDNLEALQTNGEQIVKEIKFPEGSPAVFEDMRLALGKTFEDKRRVWFHNSGAKDVTMPMNIFCGGGGNGAFHSWVGNSLPPEKKAFAWKYNRITSHKRDNVDSANGYLVWAKDGTAIGATPNLVSLDTTE